MSKIWIENGLFITMAGTTPKVLTGHMVVTDDVITYIGETRPADVEGFDRFDGKGLVFMPGLVNTHGHAAMTLLRGFSDDLNLQVWLQEKMWPMEEKYVDQDTRAGSNLAIAEMLLSGTTTFVDMYDRMDQVAEASVEAGIRAFLTRGVIGLCSPEVQTAKLEEAISFAKQWNGQGNGRISTMLSPHSPYTCPPDYIARIVQAAHDLNLPLHTHMSETKAEVQQNVDEYGKRPVAHLDALDFFSRPALLAHAVHLTDEEIELLAARGASISHNPISNLKLASGVARVPDMLKAGVKLSLGTDGVASNNNLDLFQEIRAAALLHKGVSGDPTVVPAYTALQLGTSMGAEAIWKSEIGTLEVGKKADFIAIDIDQPHFFPRTDLISHLVYAANGRDVSHVWIDGKQVVSNRTLLTMDEEKVRFEAQASFERLLN
ncbi:MAG: amidohydrolase [Candidatus Pristimantibacillus lignocellulolyticus]|uniref:5-methylthioadenosine/S-adenosylhomocysteine deaminase n=1 Tax=Candidatus Pristimantibacillus lignocellulolyticus TaxID=2994561 RepID=A0A9J6ZDD5_9BACL|nr:MAG: amidohydrolase [Candidatus Pristimantibacillus lignocellulolyticus]